MNPSRWLAGLAALLTAMLLQATLVGPLAYPLPVSLPLVFILAVAVLNGPSTGITLGFAGGLVTDLGSEHPIGLLALMWLAAGTAAGVVGGMVMPARAPKPLGRRRLPRGRRPGAPRARRTPDRRREQALLVGGLAGLASAGAAVFMAILDRGADPLGEQLLRCLPAAGLDAILVLGVLALVEPALRSVSLRPPAPLDGPHPARQEVRT